MGTRVLFSRFVYTCLTLIVCLPINVHSAPEPASYVRRAQQALPLIARGEITKAARVLGELDTAIIITPEAGRVAFLRAKVAQQQQYTDIAQRYFTLAWLTYPSLADYAAWELAQLYAAQDNLPALQAIVTALKAQYPNSLVLSDATLLLAQTQRRLDRTDAAMATLERLLAAHPSHHVIPEARWLLATIAQDKGKILRAATALRRLGETAPRNTRATKAFRRSRKLLARLPAARRPRPDAAHLLATIPDLVRAKRWEEVQLRLKELTALPHSPKLAPRIMLTRGSVAFRRRRYSEAKKWLQTFINRYPRHDRIAEAHYLLARVYRRQRHTDSSEEHYQYVIRHHSHSQWAAKSLLALAKMAEKADDFPKAAALYQRMADDFLTHEDAAESLWRAAWLHYQVHDYTRADQLWQHFEDAFPNDDLLPRALYWQARIATHRRQQPKANAFYQRIVREYPFHYYSFLARTQLQHVGARVPQMTIPHETTVAWELHSPVTLPAVPTTVLTPPQFHLLRVREFQQLRMPIEARHEIRRLQSLLPDTHATRYFLATLYSANAHHLDAFIQLNQIVSTLHPETLRGLSRDFWTMLYPKPFWRHVREYAATNDLNPHLVLSIMRQESAFNPRARSYAGARGLMQLMPKTARQVSRALHIRRFRKAMLFRPASNIALGTHYIAAQLERYKGNRVLALAAYNAGPHRAYRWQKKWAHLPLDEFIERIPFRETRLYVKLILRNMMAYEYLYPDLPES